MWESCHGTVVNRPKMPVEYVAYKACNKWVKFNDFAQSISVDLPYIWLSVDVRTLSLDH